LIRTGPHAKARIQFPDGSVVVIGENQCIQFVYGERRPGGVFLRQPSPKNWWDTLFGRGPFELDTQNGVIGAEG